MYYMRMPCMREDNSSRVLHPTPELTSSSRISLATHYNDPMQSSKSL